MINLVIRKMQIKNMRFHFFPTRVVIVKKTDNKSWWACGEIGTLVRCWWECKMVHCFEKQSGISSDVKYRITIWFTIPLGCVYIQENWKHKICIWMFIALFKTAKKYKMWISINWGDDKQIIVYQTMEYYQPFKEMWYWYMIQYNWAFKILC